MTSSKPSADTPGGEPLPAGGALWSRWAGSMPSLTSMVGTPIAEEVRELAKLAGPLILGFVGNNLMGLVDTAMVGRIGATELAGVSIGSGLFFTVTVGGMGIVFGMDPVVSQALGAGEGARARAAFRAGLRLGAWVAAPCVAALLAVPYALPWMGIDAGVCEAARGFLFARAPGAVPFIMMMALRSLLQARGKTSPLAYAMIVGNIVNFLGNLLLIFGDSSLERVGLPGIGLPALGVVGAGLASTFATIAQLLVVLHAHLKLPPASGGGDTNVPLSRLLRIGVPIGITLVAEIGAFTLAGLFAARLGPNPGSGHQVAIMLASLTFNVAMAVSNAASVRVGHAVGRGDTPAARKSGLVALGVVVFYMSLTAMVFLGFARPLAKILTDRDGVLLAAIPLIHIAAAFQIFDGVQSVAAGVLRGLGETRSVTVANLIGYYVIGLPIAFVLSITLGMGVQGLWWGLSGGLAFVAITLTWRFIARSARHVERVA